MGLNKVVDFSTAKLLKEKGFDEPCRFVHDTWNNIKDWIEDGDGEHQNSHKNASIYYSAPTIAEVVCWIYSKYQIWIQVSILKDNEWHYSIRRKDNNWNIEFPTKEKYISIENAYEKGINIVLNTYEPKS